MSEELNPCKECGGKGYLFGYDDDEVDYWVACMADFCYEETRSYDTPEAAIAEWNEPTEEQKLRVELSKAQAEIADLEHNRKDNIALLWKVEQQQKELEKLREKTDVTFDMNFGNRIAHCQESNRQEYADCVFSAGLVSGIEPDTIYLEFWRNNEPTTFFLRPDEAQVIITILSGALWSSQIADLQEAEK